MKTETKLAIVPADEDMEDIGISIAEEATPLLPPGEYEVGFLRASGKFKGYQRDNIYLYFQVITPGAYAGKTLYLAARISPPLAASSKYVRAWSIAAEYVPTRRDRLSPQMFKGKYFRALVETVKKDEHRRKLPALLQYSTIGMLLKKNRGRVNQHRNRHRHEHTPPHSHRHRNQHHPSG